MKKNLHAMLVLVLVLGIAVTMGGCPLAGDGEDDPAFVAMSDGATTTICVQNIGGGVTGGTDHGFCEENPDEQDEWHFVINGLDPLTAAPESITAEFDAAGTVIIPVEKVTQGGVAHYTLKGLYLDETLLSACAEIDSTATYNRFNLSHAPCGEAPPVGYNLTISSTAGGSVSTPGEGTFTYDAGTVVNLVATAAAGYQFVSWTGDVGTIANVNSASTTITMNGNYSITANFAKIQYELTVGSTAGGSVSTPGEGTFTYDAGTVVNLVATAAAGYQFVSWTGDVGTIANVNSASTTITMNGNYSITANFAKIQYELTVGSTAGGSVSTPGEGTFTYDAGTVVNLVATAAAGYQFVSWTGDVGTIANVNSASTTITMNGNYSITANFAKIQYELTVGSTAGGSVSTPGEGTFTYDAGTVVNLVATAAAGYQFVSWTGDVGTIANVNSASTTITMNGNYSITANFAKIQYELTVGSTAGGSVSTPGEGTFTYDAGTVVNLVATAAAGYQFVSWTGDVGTIANVNSASTTITMNGNYSITANFAKIQYELTVGSTAGGSVSTPGEGTFTYDAGTVVNLVATAAAGYQFVSWTGDVGTIANVNSASTTITMNGNYSITANFAKIQYELTVGSTAGGSVSTPGEGTFTYDAGTVVNLVATAAAGYQFVSWTGDVGTIANVNSASTTITMNGNYSITANFAKIQYELTVGSTAGGSVSTPGEGTFTYDAGTVVNLVATAAAGYQFVSWTGDVGTIANVNSASTTITMNGNYSITANFAKIQYELTVGSTAGGSVSTPGEGTFTYDAGTVVNLVATAAAGYQFVSWTGDVGTIANVNSASTTITMNGNYSITANFAKIQYELTVGSTAGGSVSTPGEGTFTYDAGTVVNLVATAAAGYQFVSWTGDVGTIANVNSASTTITMNGNYSITANFAKIQYELTVGSTAGGSVSTPGEGTFTYDAGTVVNLVATPDAGYRFRHWSGDVGGTSPSTTITMDSDKSVAASFIRQYTLTMAVSPSGSGTTGPGVGSHTYDVGAVVNLSAASNAGYRFDQWSGDVSGTSASTSITMDSDKSVTANFIRQYTLTVAVSPPGSGTTGPSVGSHTYDAGTVVNLSAAANAGYRFDQWSGDASGASPSTSITMDSDKSVTASFIRQYTLTMAVSPSGSGTTGPSVGSHTYDAGTVVNLVATAAAGYQFVSWTGDVGTIANVNSASTTITMNGNYSVTANFAKIQYELTVGSTAGGSVSTPGEGTFTYDAGTVVNLVATPDTGYRFDHWSGDVSGSSASTSITMDSDKSVTANFVAVYQLTVSSTPGGLVVVPGEGTFTYRQGTVVNLVAEPAAGYRFVRWVGDAYAIALVNSASTTITIQSDYRISARFERGVGGPAVRITGVTKGVDGALLPGADVVLYQNGEAVANAVSDEIGYYYALVASGPGAYDVLVSREGFGNEARSISVSELTTCILDFVGDYGLIPHVPSTPYVLACMSLWKFGEPPLQLSTSKMLQVISAWLYG